MSGKRSVLVVYNDRKPRAMDALDEVCALVEQHGRLVRVAASRDVCDNLVAALRDDVPDLVIVLGGDGSILSTARKLIAFDSPLLGINAGRVGFMAGYDLGTFRRDAGSILTNGALHTHAHRTLVGEVVDQTGSVRASALALNELVVTAGPPYRMISLDLTIDGQTGPSVSGDGLIVSTPLGSTAYNISAGGPIMAPGVDASVITPIAAHSLSFRPIVVGTGTPVDISVRSVNSTEECGTTLLVDGQAQHRLEEGDTVRIRSGDRSVRFVADPATGYWRTLLGKMHWASVPRGELGDAGSN